MRTNCVVDAVHSSNGTVVGDTLTTSAVPLSGVDEYEASTVFHLPQREVYDLLFEFRRFPEHVEYLDAARVHGDGAGARFRVVASWWRLSTTLRGRVTDVDPPERIDWTLTNDADASGHWSIEPAPEASPPDGTATRLRLVARLDGDSVDASGYGPRFGPSISLDWVLGKVAPLVAREGERLLGNLVAELEGEPRPVEIEVHSLPDAAE